MKVGGISIIFLLGVLNFILVLFQMSSGSGGLGRPSGFTKGQGSPSLSVRPCMPY